MTTQVVTDVLQINKSARLSTSRSRRAQKENVG